MCVKRSVHMQCATLCSYCPLLEWYCAHSLPLKPTNSLQTHMHALLLQPFVSWLPTYLRVPWQHRTKRMRKPQSSTRCSVSLGDMRPRRVLYHGQCFNSLAVQRLPCSRSPGRQPVGRVIHCTRSFHKHLVLSKGIKPASGHADWCKRVTQQRFTERC